MEKNLMQEIEELTKTKAKYENMKSHYMEYAKKLQEAQQLISEVIEAIDPYTAVRETNERTNRNRLREVEAEVKEKLLSGVEVSTDFLVKAYPDLNIGTIRYLLRGIREMHGVRVRKEGVKVFFFYPKDYM